MSGQTSWYLPCSQVSIAKQQVQPNLGNSPLVASVICTPNAQPHRRSLASTVISYYNLSGLSRIVLKPHNYSKAKTQILLFGQPEVFSAALISLHHPPIRSHQTPHSSPIPTLSTPCLQYRISRTSFGMANRLGTLILPQAHLQYTPKSKDMLPHHPETIMR